MCPAKSQAQRGYLASKFGPAWLKRHHFDNPGPLPKHVGDKKPKKAPAGKKKTAKRKGRKR